MFTKEKENMKTKMKKLLYWLGYVLLTIFGLLVCAALFVYFRGIPKYPYNPPPEIASLQVKADSQRITRGAKIASMQCEGCHADPKTGLLTGHIMTDLPKEFGKVASMNITHDPEFGIGKWTDGELYYFLRTAIRPDGHYNAIMGGYQLLADEDLYSIIAWLRSDAPSLKASKDEYPPNEPNFLVKLLCNTLFKPKPLPSSPITIPDSTQSLAYGRYLACALYNCYQCHSADFKTMNTEIPEKSEGFFGGGNPMLNLDGEIVRSANITMSPTNGIGNWTFDEFYQAVVNGKKRNGGSLHYPMMPHTVLNTSEVRSIWEYLKTIPIIENKVERYVEKN